MEKLLREIGAKYEEYGIDQQPVVFIKADSGTYGMGVMTVRDADEVLALNRKQRTRMSRSKEGLLPGPCRARRGRQPERSRHALRTAGLRRVLHHPRSGP